MRSQAPGVALLLFVCLLSSSEAAGWHSRRLLEVTSYKNLLDAAQSEVKVIQQLYNGVFREQGWANTEDFRPLLKVALNPSTNLTALFPADDSWQRVADYYCLTQQGVLDNIANLREMLANYIKAHLVPNQTLHSKDFRDGLVLQSLAKPTTDPLGPSVNHTLSKVVTPNGTVKWVFKNASIYKIPGTYDYEDITINPHRMDIKAGNAVIHVIDTLFRNSETERFWEGLRQQVLERAGYPANSVTCPANATASKPETFSRSQIAGMVIGVVIGLLLLAGLLLLIFVVRAHDRSFLRFGPLKNLSTISGRRRTDGGGSSSPGGDGDSPASGSGDVFSSPLLHTAHGQRLLAQQPSTGASSAAGSWATRVSTSSITSSMNVKADATAADPMSVVNEESPFAAASGLSQVLPVAALTPGHHVQRQPSSLAGDTATDSSGGYHRHTDSFGSGTPFVSRGSGHGSKKDLAALAAAHHAANGNGLPDHEQYDSLGMGGALALTESVPVGRINHEHVIPLSDLSLKELIGSGAEGKVYRGTWKHTDIAAKEYLPIEPAQDVGTSSSKADSPSDAAMAHARAALAKEVHWLTSLNHPNLVRFCAVCLERPLVVMEFYKHGSVFAMLQKAARELARSQQARRKGYVAHFNWDRRLEMLHDVAAGMSYLHGKDHVHGDLRSPNLFVGADSKVKIGDFGFTKRLACNTATLKVKRITHPRWVAPELMMDNMMSRASDVYSFGVIMYELLTFRIPFDMLGKEQVVINVVQGFRPEVPEETQLPPGTSSSTCLFTYVRLMKECWAHDPAQRPSFEVIARRLKAMQRWRRIISKHGTLHRAASALRQSSSSNSLTKEPLANGNGAGKGSSTPRANGNSSPCNGSVDALTGSAATSTLTTLTANGAGTSVASGLSRARSSQLPPGQTADGNSGMLPPRVPLSPAMSVAPSQPTHPAQSVPYYSSMDCDDDSLPEFEEFEDVDAAQAFTSAPVSEAVVQGTRLAVIGVCSHQADEEALASVAGAELSLARKVVLVGSDLPAGAFARSMRSSQNSLEDRSRRAGSVTGSFTAAGLQLDQAARFHSVSVADVGKQQRQQQGTASAAVASGAAALASAAAATAAVVTGHRLPPNGKVAAAAARVDADAAAAVPAVKTAAAAAPAGAAVAGSRPDRQPAQQQQQQQRRHSDPLPPKSRLSAEEAPAAPSPTWPDSATAVSSGQSPFAFVHVAPPGLQNAAELQQQLQLQAQEQQDVDVTMQFIQSYPLSNLNSEMGSPLPSASSTPELAGSGWTMHQSSKHAGKKKQQQPQHWQSAGKQQQQRVQQTHSGPLQQQGSSSRVAMLQQQQQPAQQQQGFSVQQHRQQQQQLAPDPGRASSMQQQSAFEAGGVRAAAAAAAADAGDPGSADEGVGEVYTPFDSPFYQDLTWAPSASVSGFDSNQGSVSVRSSGAAAAGGAGMASDSGSLGALSPFQHLLVQAGLRSALGGASTTSSAGTGVPPAGLESSLSPPPLPLLPQAESVISPLPTDLEPQLKPGLTIEYSANLTPMAAAAVEAVLVHGGRRSLSVPLGSNPGSRPGSVVGPAGPQAAAAAAVAAAGGRAAGVSGTQRPGSASSSGGASSGGGRGGSHADVAACADTAGSTTSAAAVLMDGLGAKAHSVPGAKSPTRSTTPVSDQQSQLRPWRSHMDAPRAAAGAAADVERGGRGSDGHDEPPAAAAAAAAGRPAWLERLLGGRRSVPGGA